MSRWFRFYDEALDDPKVQMLRPELFKAWVNVLCLASKNGGVLPTDEEICFALRLSEEKACELLRDLQGRGLIDVTEQGRRPHNWDKRQYKSDVSTGRVKRHRNKERNGDETFHGTPPETETETETETDNNIGGGSTIRAPAAAAELKLDKGDLQRQCEQASGLSLGSRKIEVIERLVADGFDLEGRVLPLLRSISKELRDWGKPPPDTWAYFDKPIRDLSRKPPASAVQVEQVFVKKDSPEWCAIIAKKGFLADFVRERTVIADGIPGAYVAKAQLPQLGAA